MTPWAVAHQSLSVKFSRQEYWSGLPFPSPGDLPDPRIGPCLLIGGRTLYHCAVWPAFMCCCLVAKFYPTLQPCGLQNTRLSCPSLSSGVCSNLHPLSRWCHPTISSSVVPFSSCLQSFPASGSFPVSQLFASDGQRIRASASVLPTNIQFLLGLTGLISLLSKEISRAFSKSLALI